MENDTSSELLCVEITDQPDDQRHSWPMYNMFYGYIQYVCEGVRL